MNFASTMIKLFKHWFSVEFLLVERYVQGALRKDLLMAPSIECFKTATLGRSYKCILPVLGTICKGIAFLLYFCMWKVIYRVFYERSYALLISLSALKQLLWEGIADQFSQHLEQITWPLDFCWIFADRKSCTGCSTKEAVRCSFQKRFEIATLGRFYWWILPVLRINYSNMALLSIFCWWKIMYRVLYERNGTLLFS